MCQNKPKVGLKDCYVESVAIWPYCQNKPKVGLKEHWFEIEFERLYKSE